MLSVVHTRCKLLVVCVLSHDSAVIATLDTRDVKQPSLLQFSSVHVLRVLMKLSKTAFDFGLCSVTVRVLVRVTHLHNISVVLIVN